MERLAALARFMRANWVGVGAALVLLGLASLAVRWIAKSREAPPPRKVMQFTMVNVEKPPPPKAPPPPPQPQKVEETREEAQPNRIEIKPMDLPPPDAPPPPAGGGQLSLAAEGEGPGDAFNLAGKPGGRGLLSGGGLGDGTGDGLGQGSADARNAYYYSKVQGALESVLRRSKRLRSASLSMEIRISWDDAGRVTKAQPVKSSGDPAIDREYQDLVGLTLPTAIPPDVPKPVVLRIRARRPQ
jgi:TonB family protein